MNTLKNKMKTFSSKAAPKTSVEGWDTRFGKSVRVVKRASDGTFISNVSAKQLSKTV